MRPVARKKKGEITPQQVEQRLMEIADRCMEATPHRVWNKADKIWEEDGVWTFDAANAIRALMEIGKYLGVEGGEETGDVTVRVIFEDGKEEYAG